jgi:hypothetical protein
MKHSDSRQLTLFQDQKAPDQIIERLYKDLGIESDTTSPKKRKGKKPKTAPTDARTVIIDQSVTTNNTTNITFPKLELNLFKVSAVSLAILLSSSSPLGRERCTDYAPGQWGGAVVCR